MPSKLRIERPEADGSTASALQALPVILLTAVPVYLLFLAVTGLRLPAQLPPGFAPWTHLIVILAGIGLAATISTTKTRILNDDEIVLPRQESWRGLRHEWRLLAPLFIPAITGLVAAAVWAPALAADPAPPMPTPGSLLFTWATAIAVAVITSTLFTGSTPPRVSDEGYRTGILHFIPWSDIHHITRRGRLLFIFHRAAPDGPIHAVITDPKIDAILDPYLTRHQVPQTADFTPRFLRFRRGLVLASLALAAAGAAAAINRWLDPRWVTLITLALALALALYSDWWRGAFHTKMIRPHIERRAEADERRASEAVQDYYDRHG